jgi:hypothetical protein
MATVPPLQLHLRGEAVLTLLAESVADCQDLGDVLELNLEGSCAIHIPKAQLLAITMGSLL